MVTVGSIFRPFGLSPGLRTPKEAKGRVNEVGETTKAIKIENASVRRDMHKDVAFWILLSLRPFLNARSDLELFRDKANSCQSQKLQDQSILNPTKREEDLKIKR